MAIDPKIPVERTGTRFSIAGAAASRDSHREVAPDPSDYPLEVDIQYKEISDDHQLTLIFVC